MRRRPNPPCSQTTSLICPKALPRLPIALAAKQILPPARKVPRCHPLHPLPLHPLPSTSGPSLSLLPGHTPPLTQSTVLRPPASGPWRLLGYVSLRVPFPLLFPASPEQPLLLGAPRALVLSGTRCLSLLLYPSLQTSNLDRFCTRHY